MKINKGLAGIVFATGLALSGCSTKICYDLPNEERVCIEERIGNDSMIITKTDGIIIEIFYSGALNSEDPGVSYVKITKDKITKEYRQPEILEEAKKQIVDYAKKSRQDEVEKALKYLQ